MPPPSPADSSSGSGKTVGIVIAIVAACVLVLVGLGVAIFFVAQSAIRTLDPGATPSVQETEEPRDEPVESENGGSAPELLPLIVGAAGPATAADPTACPGDCFAEDVFGEIGLDSAEYEALGVPDQTESWGDFADTTPGKEYTYAARYWNENEGTPVECFPVYIQVPLATTYELRPEATGETIAYLGYFSSSDESSGLQESARHFADSAAAEAHMMTFKDLVAACTEYEIGTGADYWTADVSPMPALEVPSSVAAVGWVEDSPWGRYYATDLQRGNLVIRAALYTDGSVTEEAYREYVSALAEQLAGLDTE